MWRDMSVSVVFPTYNEKDSIYQAIMDFWSTGYVDEIVVVNNNAAPGTDEEVARTPARLVYESRQGYGYSCRRGLTEAKGELIILAEPDGTFSGHDVVKLLAYSDDFDVVFGSRTSRELVWEGANMGWLIKWGNWFLGKIIEFAYNTTSLTDAGCTMRLIRQGVLRKLEPHFTVGGSHFGPEMMVLSIITGARTIEVPLNYRKRVGKSSVTGSKLVALGVGMRMLNLVLTYRMRSFWPGSPLRKLKGNAKPYGARRGS